MPDYEVGDLSSCTEVLMLPAPSFLTCSELAFWSTPESIYKEPLKVAVWGATSRDICELIESSSPSDTGKRSL